MLSKADLDEMEDWVLSSFPIKKCDNLSSKKFRKRMKDKYGLLLLAEDGVSRTVYKKPYSREVVKFTYFIHNIAEHEVWKRFCGTGVQESLAACNNASKGGMVLSQEYMSKNLPHDRNYSGPWVQLYWGDSFLDLRRIVGNVFANTENEALDVEDFHQSNLMYNNQGVVKIIDYASVAECLTKSYYLTFAATNAQRIRGQISKALKRTVPIDKYLSMYYGDNLLEVWTDTEDTAVSISIPTEKAKELNS